MSIGSKMRRARQTAKRRRDKAKKNCAIHWEVRAADIAAYVKPFPLGNHDRSMACADVVVIHGGDLIHHMPVDRSAYDISAAREHIADFNKMIAEAMSPRIDWSTVRDVRRDPVTGRIRPWFNDEDEL